jgi:hypothetical protein
VDKPHSETILPIVRNPQSDRSDRMLQTVSIDQIL